MTGTIIIVAPGMFQRIERADVRRVEIDSDDDVIVWLAGANIVIETDPDDECPFAGDVQASIAKAMFADLSALECPQMFGADAIVYWEYAPEAIERVNGNKIPAWRRSLLNPFQPDPSQADDATEFSIQ